MQTAIVNAVLFSQALWYQCLLWVLSVIRKLHSEKACNKQSVPLRLQKHIYDNWGFIRKYQE